MEGHHLLVTPCNNPTFFKKSRVFVCWFEEKLKVSKKSIVLKLPTSLEYHQKNMKYTEEHSIPLDRVCDADPGSHLTFRKVKVNMVISLSPRATAIRTKNISTGSSTTLSSEFSQRETPSRVMIMAS